MPRLVIFPGNMHIDRLVSQLPIQCLLSISNRHLKLNKPNAEHLMVPHLISAGVPITVNGSPVHQWTKPKICSHVTSSNFFQQMTSILPSKCIQYSTTFLATTLVQATNVS